MNMKYRKSEGFALVELLVVLSIIGVLSGMVLVSVSEAKEKARDSKRVQQIGEINKAIELYKSDNGGNAPILPGTGPGGISCSREYADELGTNEEGYCVAVSGGVSGGSTVAWDAFKQAIGPYMNNQVPEDPCPSCADGLAYVYIAPAAVPGALSDGDYQIYANLERNTSQTGHSTTGEDFVNPPNDDDDGDGGDDSSDTTPPTEPTGVSFSFDEEWSGGSLGTHISWDASTDAGGSGIKGYLIPQIDLEEYVPQHEPTPGTTRDHYVLEWAQGTEACYSVKAVDNAGNVSGLSEEICADVPTNYSSLQVPSSLHADTSNYPAIVFSWQNSVSPVPASSVVYEVYKVGNATPVIANQSTIQGMYHTWNVNDSSSFWTNTFCYTVRVRATNPNNGQITYSDMSGQYCAEPPLPPVTQSVSVPGNLQTVINGNGSASFSWSASVSTYPFPNQISSYEISKCVNGICSVLTTDLASPFNVSAGAVNSQWGGAPVCWKIRAVDIGGHWSDMSSMSCQP